MAPSENSRAFAHVTSAGLSLTPHTLLMVRILMDGFTILELRFTNYAKFRLCRITSTIASETSSVSSTLFTGLYFIYSSWSAAVHICNIYGETQTQTALEMRPQNHRFACFSVKFSHDNREVLAGANDGAIYVYDRSLAYRTLRIPVSAICVTQ